MRKPWSISTTVRNSERIRDFLKVLNNLRGQEWTRDNQRKYQIMLIQYKVYGYGSQQFYNGLSQKHFQLMNTPDPLSFNDAKEILESKNYEGGGDMRGRQSFNPLEKMGLAFLDNENKVRISAVGNYFLQEDYDLGKVFFRSFLKWQLPNPDSRDFRKEDGFNVNPLIASLKLIFLVNKKWSKLGNKPVGISKKEFSLFIPTLGTIQFLSDFSFLSIFHDI
ncbi:MAG: AlwI family type II restriction endonuclease, partial [Nanoarchaeota archaeon]